MSTWAFSEMPMAVRLRVEPFFHLGTADKALFAYQPAFEGADNRAYFRACWLARAIGGLGAKARSRKPPTPQDSLYMFGRCR